MEYLYGTFYRSPNSPGSVWGDIEYSIELTFNTNIKYKNIIITGDFNATLFSYNAKFVRLNKRITTFDMYQGINEPTHYTENSSSLLDVMTVSNSSVLSSECFLGQYIRYLCPVFGLVNQPISFSLCFQRNIWLFGHGNYDKFRGNLRLINIDKCIMDFNESYD